MEHKYCPKCEDSHLLEKFHKNRSKKDGYSDVCKECWNKYLKARNKSGFRFQREKKPLTAKDLDLAEQPTKIREIVFALAENPKISCEDLAMKVELAPDTVRNYMKGNRFLANLRSVASQRLTLMIPDALKALDKSLTAKSEDVALKASIKVLESERILGPERMDVTVNDLSNKTWEEVVGILEKTPLPPTPTLEAEVIS